VWRSIFSPLFSLIFLCISLSPPLFLFVMSHFPSLSATRFAL
jgi:hypothetical protein